ncbi:hypothetical protein Q4485_07835 [Granulosicoccaceae sp. 1_MG-2023]|nr:hypothetical protein [Granulosicoccaceae sp. 1_MG-2023]
MSDDTTLTELAIAAPAGDASGAVETVAMVYRNEYNEVSHIVGSELSAGADADFSRVVLVLVLSLVAMVVISRRPAEKTR